MWGVCRRHLPDHADAEDAFQAAFLVLVRRAKGLTTRTTLGPWLYRVAAWTARNLRRKNARRLARKSPLTDAASVPPAVPDNRLDLDAALLALPQRYRDPIVLCHLEGLSRRDAAERLGCPEGTLSSLLSRGLTKLRFRLAGHEFIAAVPVLLAASTVRAASATQVAVSAAVTHLMEGVLRMFWVKKATAAVAALVVVFGFGVGVGVSSRIGTAAADEKGATLQTPPGPNARLVDLAYIDLHDCENALRAIYVGYAAVKQQLEGAKPGEAKHAELSKNVDLLVGAFDAARQKVYQARLRLADAKGKQVPGGELASLKDQLKEAEAAHRKAQLRATLAERKASAIKDLVEKGAADRQSYTDALKLVYETEVEFAAAKMSSEALAAVVRERESMPNGPCLIVTAVPLAPAGEWVVSEYGPGGKLIGSMTVEHETMLTRYLARTAKDTTAPKELRIVVRDGASLMAAFTAVSAAMEAGFKKVKFTGIVPTKGNIPAGSKDLPRRHLDDADTEKLYKELLGNLMKC